MSQNHYNKEYFNWQSSIGEFGGWANLTKFVDYIKPTDSVLDFGCGGGYLLSNLNCKEIIGVEINPEAQKTAISKGIIVYSSAKEVPDSTVDLVISNNALEHVESPLDELKILYKKIKPGGRIVIVVPCESIKYGYSPGDINRHLYSFSPMNLGNLLAEAGFMVSESKPYIHKWPPRYIMIAKYGGRLLFDIACRVYGRIERSWFQVRAVGERQ